MDERVSKVCYTAQANRVVRVDSTFLIRGQVVLISVIDRVGSER